jgi:hypothetical protein
VAIILTSVDDATGLKHGICLCMKTFITTEWSKEEDFRTEENTLSRMEHVMSHQGRHVEYIVIQKNYNYNNVSNVNVTDGSVIQVSSHQFLFWATLYYL